jgi:hypothetical protein
MSESIRSMCKSLRLAYISEIYETIPFDSPVEYLVALFKEEFRLREKQRCSVLLKMLNS